MICNAILTFLLIFNDGHEELRTKWMTKEVAIQFIQTTNNAEFLSDIDPPKCCKAMRDIKITVVQPYDCWEGPKE